MPIQVNFLGLSGLQLWDAHTPTLIPVAIQHQPLSTPDGDNSRTGEGGLPGEQQSPGFSKVVETIFSGWSRENNWHNTGERRPPSLLKIGLLAISSPVLPLSQHLFCLDQEDKVFLPTSDWEWGLHGVWNPFPVRHIQTMKLYWICRVRHRNQISWFLEQTPSPTLLAHIRTTIPDIIIPGCRGY